MKYYELLRVKGIEDGFGYGKYATTTEKTIKKSVNLESLIQELEKHNKDWIIVPRGLVKQLRYDQTSYIITKTEEEIEGLE